MACRGKTVPLSDILPYVLPNCNALPEEMAMDYGRRAYIEFARRSGAMCHVVVDDLQEGVRDYPIDVPTGFQVNRINWVEIERHRIVSPSFDHNEAHTICSGSNQQLYQNYSGGAMNGSYGYGPNYWCACGPWQFTMQGYECLWLYKAPIKDHENGIRIEFSVFPTQDICVFDADFFDRWVEGIAYGALSRALLLPNTDWYDKQESMLYAKKFNIEIQRARHKFDLNYSRGPMRMQAKRFV